MYPPFCTPAIAPYSITSLNSHIPDADILDLNLEFHKRRFHDFEFFCKDVDNWDAYEKVAADFIKESGKIYSTNNTLVVQGKKPEFYDIFMDMILSKKPDIVAFSVVYGSQAFYAKALLEDLKDVTTVIGGPAVNDKLINLADHYFADGHDFVESVGSKRKKIMRFDSNEYFSPETIVPLKLSSTCYYKQCAFCTHFLDENYIEYDLDKIKRIIEKSDSRLFFLIDDMLPKKRLLEFARIVPPGCYWACQLRPTMDFDDETLRVLRESGLLMIIWGVESGCDRILKMMRKGTNKKDVSMVLNNSHEAGICNVIYAMFGFPTETKDEFVETVEFLESNPVDLVSSSVFGLQKGSHVYLHPEKYNITDISKTERTVLDPKLSFNVSTGMKPQEVLRLKKKMQKRIDAINKFPKAMNFFREHMLYRLLTLQFIKG